MPRPLLIGLIVTFAVLHVFLKHQSVEVSQAPTPGTSAASVFETLRDPRAGEIKAMAQANKVTVVAFFETWCGPCKLELPHLAKLYDERHADGLAVVGIYSPSSSDIAGFKQQYNLNFPLMQDTQGALAGAWGVDAVPTSVVLDANLQVIHAARGYQPLFVDELQALLDKERPL